jgi:L-alanine-DL-glutamate epimerase-like enolase superfamily enzyme
VGEKFGRTNVSPDVGVYAAGGYYYPGEGVDALQAELRRHAAAGYVAAKIKVGGAPLAEDLRRIEAALEVVGESDRLAVDANGRFTAAEAIDYGEALAPYRLRWFEEPVDPTDLEGCSAVASGYAGAIATGENLFSAIDLNNLVVFGGLRPSTDILQMDPGLAYGLTEYGRMMAVLRERGWNEAAVVPHGGHRFALHVAAGLQLAGCEAYPELFDPIGTFGPDVEVSGGTATIPDLEGIGVERITGLAELVRDL